MTILSPSVLVTKMLSLMFWGEDVSELEPFCVHCLIYGFQLNFAAWACYKRQAVCPFGDSAPVATAVV